MQNWYEKYQEEKELEKGKLFRIFYTRDIKGTDHEITLTPDECSLYGYTAKPITIDEINGYVYQDSNFNVMPYSVIGNDIVTNVIVSEKGNEIEHLAPACSSFRVSFADVDKDGSGRNEINGTMQRERIGSYSQIEVTWDLIPNTTEYNNWYKILTHLPPTFNIDALYPDGERRIVEVYRGDVSTTLYCFLDKQHQLWQGLSTTFIQVNVDPYDDTYEPDLTNKSEVSPQRIRLEIDGESDALKKKVNDNTTFNINMLYGSNFIKTLTFQNVYNPYFEYQDFKYVTCEPARVVLNDEFMFDIGGDNVVPLTNAGFWTQMYDINGETTYYIDTPVIKGLTGTFFRLWFSGNINLFDFVLIFEEVCPELTIAYQTGNYVLDVPVIQDEIETIKITNNKSTSVKIIPNDVSKTFNVLTIQINKTMPYRMPKLKTVIFGNKEVLTGDTFTDYTILREKDFTNTQIVSDNLSIRYVDLEKKYTSLDNVNLIRENSKIRFYIDDKIEFSGILTSKTTDRNILSLECGDITTLDIFNRSFKHLSDTTTPKYADEYIKSLFSDNSLKDLPIKFDYDTSNNVVRGHQFYGEIGDVSLIEAVRLICEASGISYYFTTDNTMVFFNDYNKNATQKMFNIDNLNSSWAFNTDKMTTIGIRNYSNENHQIYYYELDDRGLAQPLEEKKVDNKDSIRVIDNPLIHDENIQYVVDDKLVHISSYQYNIYLNNKADIEMGDQINIVSNEFNIKEKVVVNRIEKTTSIIKNIEAK